MSMKAIEKKQKRCTRCKKIKKSSSFYKQRQIGKNGQVWEYYDSMCRKCRTIYSRERACNQKIKAIKYKGGKCYDCGLIDHPNLYDFHHPSDVKKDFEISKYKYKSSLLFFKEVDKCVLLCCMCHRRRHIVAPIMSGTNHRSARGGNQARGPVVTMVPQ